MINKFKDNTVYIIMLAFISYFVFSMNCSKTTGKGTIIAELTNFKCNDGTIKIGLYNKAKGFPLNEESIFTGAHVKLSNKQATVTFKNIPFGTYAIAGYQDVNKNGKFDIHSKGNSQEAMLFSNNAKAKYGPPKFDAAKFELRSNDLKLKIDAQFLEMAQK